jgi:Mg-chelatase subunit ChlD
MLTGGFPMALLPGVPLHLEEPAFLLALFPLAWGLWTWRERGWLTLALRAAVGFLLTLALSGPVLERGGHGRDLIVVVDRSRSMPPGADASFEELIRLAEDQRESGDRLGVVAFGSEARIEQLPAEGRRFAGFARDVDLEGSDLAGALSAALDTLTPGRDGAILVISDGESTGADAQAVAYRAAARGVPIHVRELSRERTGDLAVESLEVPEQVAIGEPFQFSAWVFSPTREEREVVLLRGGQVVQRRMHAFQPGRNRLVFRDLPPRPGVADYEVRVSFDGDAVPENNRGLGGVLVQGRPGVLLLNDDGQPSSLSLALEAQGIDVTVRSPELQRLTPIGLSAYRAVLLENVDAGRLGFKGLGHLADFVTERGGGLLLTGGKASFALGGYFDSALDELLPVSLERREETRKLGLAMAIAMDRSGSMGMTVANGRTKMELANAGAAGAIELLSPLDSVSVIAVDTQAHVIVPMSKVDDPLPLARQVRGIQSTGGGIATFTALKAAAEQLNRSTQRNKHIVLFADASDANEQGGCVALLSQLEDFDITCSVIALGTEFDPHAQFLKDLAATGRGEAYFTTEAQDLRRLFNQDTLRVSRSLFVEDPTGVQALPGLLGIGELRADRFPDLGGYNLTYLRPEATAGAITTDEYAAPVFASAYRGLGRTAAFTGQIGGTFGSDVVAWDQFGAFFASVSRWLTGLEEPETLFASARREGSQAVLSVELDAGAPVPAELGRLAASFAEPDGTTSRLTLERVEEDRFEARLPLDQVGVGFGTLELPDGRTLTLPPVALPYSPELERGADPNRGQRVLERLSRATGGKSLATLSQLYAGERSGLAWRSIAAELGWIALLLMLLEIAGRRLQLWGNLESDLARLARRVPRWRSARADAAARESDAGSGIGASATGPRASGEPSRSTGVGAASEAASGQANGEGAAPKPAPGGLGAALDRAKQRADQQLER